MHYPPREDLQRNLVHWLPYDMVFKKLDKRCHKLGKWYHRGLIFHWWWHFPSWDHVRKGIFHWVWEIFTFYYKSLHFPHPFLPFLPFFSLLLSHFKLSHIRKLRIRAMEIVQATHANETFITSFITHFCTILPLF